MDCIAHGVTKNWAQLNDFHFHCNGSTLSEEGLVIFIFSVDNNKLQKILKEMSIPDHLTCLLRNLYTGQEEIELDMEQQTGSK